MCPVVSNMMMCRCTGAPDHKAEASQGHSSVNSWQSYLIIASEYAC